MSDKAREKRDKGRHRLDVDLGTHLRAWVDDVATASGQTAGEVVRDAVQLLRLEHSVHRDAVRNAVMAVADALAPDERYDPADDPRLDEPLRNLARILQSAAAAEGVAEALLCWMTDRQFPTNERNNDEGDDQN